MIQVKYFSDSSPLRLIHPYLVFLLHEVDGLLGLGVDVLEQLPQLGHLGLAPPVQVRLALAAALRLRQPLAQAQDLRGIMSGKTFQRLSKIRTTPYYSTK